jgi:hypothetical protein
MFGYVVPMSPELKVRELERFKSCYCGLCRAIGKNYGIASRFILNYDFVFLAMLLWGESDAPTIKSRRCIAHPCAKKSCCESTPALETCAGYSVILAYNKLRDTVADEGFFKSAAARLWLLTLYPAYRKSRRDYPEFDKSVRSHLQKLADIEKSGADSLDMAADTFASILASASCGLADIPRRRAMEQLLYHTGRFVYIIDAVDDFAGDFDKKRYNPVARRFDLHGRVMSDDALQSVRVTLNLSLSMISSSLMLLPENDWRAVLENIVYLGLQSTAERVLAKAAQPK